MKTNKVDDGNLKKEKNKDIKEQTEKEIALSKEFIKIHRQFDR